MLNIMKSMLIVSDKIFEDNWNGKFNFRDNINVIASLHIINKIKLNEDDLKNINDILELKRIVNKNVEEIIAKSRDKVNSYIKTSKEEIISCLKEDKLKGKTKVSNKTKLKTELALFRKKIMADIVIDNGTIDFNKVLPNYNCEEGIRIAMEIIKSDVKTITIEQAVKKVKRKLEKKLESDESSSSNSISNDVAIKEILTCNHNKITNIESDSSNTPPLIISKSEDGNSIYFAYKKPPPKGKRIPFYIHSDPGYLTEFNEYLAKKYENVEKDNEEDKNEVNEKENEVNEKDINEIEKEKEKDIEETELKEKEIKEKDIDENEVNENEDKKDIENKKEENNNTVDDKKIFEESKKIVSDIERIINKISNINENLANHEPINSKTENDSTEDFEQIALDEHQEKESKQLDKHLIQAINNFKKKTQNLIKNSTLDKQDLEESEESEESEDDEPPTGYDFNFEIGQYEFNRHIPNKTVIRIANRDGDEGVTYTVNYPNKKIYFVNDKIKLKSILKKDLNEIALMLYATNHIKDLTHFLADNKIKDNHLYDILSLTIGTNDFSVLHMNLLKLPCSVINAVASNRLSLVDRLLYFIVTNKKKKYHTIIFEILLMVKYKKPNIITNKSKKIIRQNEVLSEMFNVEYSENKTYTFQHNCYKKHCYCDIEIFKK